MEQMKVAGGRPRRTRKTRRSVWVAELISRRLITTGGIGTIVAVLTVFLFLLYVVSPLFFPASITDRHEIAVDWSNPAPLQLGMDQDQLMCWALFPDGTLHLARVETGELLSKRDLFPEAKLTAVSFTPGDEEAAFGFDDGSVRLGRIHFTTSFVEPAVLPDAIRSLAANKSARWKDGIIVKTPQEQYRFQELAIDLKEPAQPKKASPILLIDHSKTTTGQVIVALTADGKLRLNTVRQHHNYNTDETTYKLTGQELPYTEPADKGPPLRLFVSAVGNQIYLFWKDGHTVRIDVRDKQAAVAEVRNVLDDPSQRVIDVRCLIGKGTFLVGDSSGRVRAWFYVPGETGGKMVFAHEFPGGGAAVAALAPGNRSRIAAIAYADGKVRLLFVTSERLMAELNAGGQMAKSLALAPNDNGLAASAGNMLWQWSYDPGYPEITMKSLFGKVWYETADRPEYVWQSTGGDAYEPKLSLVPLIFGTLKASVYSLLFGVPLALLAAIYTSEFLHPRTRAVIKPCIELMASLPSVVLGFLAGLVFAQFVESVLPAVLTSVFTIPLAFLPGAYLWQLLPGRWAPALARWRFVFICLVLPVGMLAAVPLAPVLEDVLFAGDLRGWLDRGAGSAVGGWVYLLFPVSAVVCALVMARYVNPWLRPRTLHLGRFPVAVIDLGRFLLGLVATLVTAWLIADLFTAFGWDARRFILGPYSQRNALIVGFVMGFAIIPIIYTIAEDALSSVPEHLRAGSLAAGATRWQTARRIIIPTAMSGLFSAVMIGTGRAVGETMIVLMATGNTPVMDWNIFDGFRTLSANIAVELLESVRGSAHYRTLFLAALTLFVLTFVLNTIAEFVRQRFRRRAYQL